MDEAAKNLYKKLRQIKKMGFKNISITKIPNKGVGIAINDRLKKSIIMKVIQVKSLEKKFKTIEAVKKLIFLLIKIKLWLYLALMDVGRQPRLVCYLV